LGKKRIKGKKKSEKKGWVSTGNIPKGKGEHKASTRQRTGKKKKGWLGAKKGQISKKENPRAGPKRKGGKRSGINQKKKNNLIVFAKEKLALPGGQGCRRDQPQKKRGGNGKKAEPGGEICAR